MTLIVEYSQSSEGQKWEFLVYIQEYLKEKNAPSLEKKMFHN